MEIKELEKIGLTKNESILYLTLLKNPSITSGTLVKKSNLNSGRIYDILEMLKNKGLTSETNINNVRHFSASPPEKLLEYHNKKKEEILKNEKYLINLIPELNKIKNEKNKETKVIVYTGMNGLITSSMEATKLLKENDEVMAFGLTGSKPEKISNFWRKWTKFVNKKNLSIKYIFSDNDNRHFDKTKEIGRAKCRILPADTPFSIDIFGDEAVVLYHVKDEPITSILIYDKDAVKTFKTIFEFLWSMAKE